MKGKILGMADDGGVISGDDGKRYKFASSDWKGQRPVKVGEDVDFELSAQGGAADIYPVHTAAGFDLGDVGAKMKAALGPGGSVDIENVSAKAKAMVEAGAASPAGTRALMLVTSRLIVPIALVLFVVCFLFTYMSWAGDQFASMGSTRSGGYSVIGISSLAGNAGEVFSAFGKQANATLSATQQQYDELVKNGMSDGASQLRDEISSMQGVSRGATMMSLALHLMYLIYLVPLGAAFIIYREWQDKPMPLATLVVGGLSVFGFVLAYITEWIANGTIKDFLGGMLSQVANANGVDVGMGVGLGAWLLLICGVALLLDGLGIVRLSTRSA